MRATPYHAAKHLDEAALLPAAAGCPFCGATNRARVHQLQTRPDVFLVHCAACGLSSADRMPRPDALDAYYAGYYADADPAVGALTFDGDDRFGRAIATTIGRDPATQPRLRDASPGAAGATGAAGAGGAAWRVLDFGGGDGGLSIAFGRAWIDAGRAGAVEITVVDRAPLREAPGANISLTRVDGVDGVDGVFDLVIASAILEHIPDVRGTLQALLRRVAPGGWFYARTPYWRPLLRWLPRADLTFPGHVHDIGPEFWNGAGARLDHGMRLAVTRPSIVETTLRGAPLRTIAAAALKLPGHAESRLRRTGWRRPWWVYVGGWEVFMQRTGDAP